jgi:hypothetical protein
MCFPLVTHSFRLPNHRYEVQRSGPVPTQRLAWRSDSCIVCHADNGADLSGAWYEAANTMKWGLRKCRKKKSSLILMMITIRTDRSLSFFCWDLLTLALAWTVTQLAYNVLWYKDTLSKGNELVCVTLPRNPTH